MKEKELWLREPKRKRPNWALAISAVAMFVFFLIRVFSRIMLNEYTEESIKDEMFYGLEKANSFSFWLMIASAIVLLILTIIEVKRYPDDPDEAKMI